MKQEIVNASVIIPAYQAQAHIGRAIASVLNGDALPRQIVVADDGSRDRTAELAENFRSRAEQLGISFTVLHIPHGGVSAARNAGIDKAECDWLLFCDADDTVRRGWVSELYAVKSDTRLALCGYCESGRDVLPNESGDCPLDAVVRLYAKWLLNSCCNKIYAASVIRENAILFDTDSSFGEDLDFNLRYLRKMSGFVLLDSVLYDYTPSKKKAKRCARLARQKTVYRMLRAALCEMGQFDGENRRLFFKTRRNALFYELTKK